LKDEERRLIFGISLILGGAIGNLIDRLRLREVIDFLDFHVSTYHWPAFNLADSAITLGTFWVAISLLFYSPKSSKVVK
jgi:signal peptidase II